MTERPKHTNKNKISTKDKDISLEVFSVAPSPQIAKNHDTSVYEIDIQSDFAIPNRRMKSVDSDSTESELEGRKKFKGNQPMRNPLIQSHYPNFLEISSDFSDLENKELNSEAGVKTVEEESEIPVGKAEKENQSPSRHSDSKFEKYIKNCMVDNFLLDLKGFFQNCERKMNNKGFHFHHHEHHHHHYYFNKTLVSQTSEKSGTSSPATKVPLGKRKLKNCENDKQGEKQEEQIVKTCLADDAESNATMNVKPDKKPKETKNVKCCPSLRIKNSASVESVLCKKSEFIRSHVFSDTDLTKRDSDETTDADTFEISLTEASQDSKTNYDLLMNSLKNFNDLKLPVVITDQKTVPKVSYITCQCASSDLLENVSNILLINAEKNQTKKTDVDKTSESEDTINQEGIPYIVLKIAALLLC